MNSRSSTNRPLWAPWRIEYVRQQKSGDCFFCEKIAADDDARNHLVARGNQSIVLLNTYPYNSGHVMVAPLRHCGDIEDLSAEERGELMEMAVHVKRILRKTMAPEGFNLGFNLGHAAGAGIKDHLHLHIVPRWVGDTNFMPVLAGTDVVPEALAETTRLLREAWRSDPEAMSCTKGG